MVTKEELLGTIKVPSEIPLPAFIAARERSCGAMYCLNCGSVLLLPPPGTGTYLGIVQACREMEGEEWNQDDVDLDRVYFTRPGCDQCREKKPDVTTIRMAHVTFPEDAESDSD